MRREGGGRERERERERGRERETDRQTEREDQCFQCALIGNFAISL